MLILQNISYSHPNKDLLFHNLNFSVGDYQKIALIGKLPRGLNNSGGTGGCDSAETPHKNYASYNVSLQFDRSRAVGGFYDIVQKARGILNCKAINKVFAIKFDPRKKRYLLPPNLSRLQGPD